MQILFHTIGGDIILEVKEDIRVKQLKEMIKLQLEGISAKATIKLSRDGFPEIKDTDMLVVTQHQGVQDLGPYFETDTAQVHLSGLGFSVRVSSNTVDKSNRELVSTFPKNLTNKERDKQQALEVLKALFTTKHTILLAKAKSGIFGFFRNTKLNPGWGLKDIIQHGMAHDNRTRQACVEIGWLTRDGNLSNDVPTYIRELVQPNLSLQN